jgi:hypothetical protein
MAATLQERLTEAEAAYHTLLLGNSAAEVRDSNGESIRFTSANSSRLKAYILDLKSQIAAEAAGSTQPRGPLRPVF